MPSKRFAAAIPLLVISLLAVLSGLDSPNPATGFSLPTPPPAGVLVVVNTKSDLADPGDGTCSLRAAIEATNINGHAGNCDATGSHAGATDGITFKIGTGTPVINVGSTPLPDITDRLTINGNTGGADRVELYGPGATPNIAGLTIDSSAPGTTIDHLTVDNFGGTEVSAYAANVTLTGNFIGTNASGTAVGAGGSGIGVSGANVTIGGSVGTSTGGPAQASAI